MKILNVRNKAVRIEHLRPTIRPSKEYFILTVETNKHDAEHAKQTLKELKLDHLSEREKHMIEAICLKYNDIFA